MSPDRVLPPLLRQPTYLISAHTPRQWPPDEGHEVAFAGRSNVGKSSAINAITRRNRLARTSKTPGRTQQIVFFRLDHGHRLVDLPGYGYAKVPDSLRQHWGQNIERFLLHRNSLRGLFLLMDIRRPGTELDKQMLDWCGRAGLRVHILLTKADKLGRGGTAQAVLEAKREQSPGGGPVSVQAFSAVKGTGVPAAQELLVRWLTEGSAGS